MRVANVVSNAACFDVTGVAAKAGLEYRFDLLQHTNTVKAHELLHFAKAEGRQREMAERLMSAYFTEGRHVGRIDDLVELATEAGLDADAARDELPTADELRAAYMTYLLDRFDGRRHRVAEILGVSERNTYRLLKKL